MRRPRLTQGCSAERKGGRKEGRKYPNNLEASGTSYPKINGAND